MPLNPKFVLGPSLEMLFIDKDTLAPLAGGIVTFTSQDTGNYKDVYTIAYESGDYTYTNIGHIITLNGDGSFSDNDGNNILPYFYPYQGDPNVGDSDVIELYHVAVESAEGVAQFTRDGWPNFSSASGEANQQIKNYIPNGQFLLHNNSPPPTHTVDYGGGDGIVTVTEIAQGGWTFEVGPGVSQPTYTITFPEYAEYESDINGSPKFACNVVTTSGDPTIVDLRCKWPDVNKFASDDQEYTFMFTAYSSGGNVNCYIQYIKYFGTGGATTVDTTFTESPIVITSTITNFALTQVFGSNEGDTIGAGNYFQVAIRFPNDQTSNVTITDCMLVSGNVEAVDQPFPTTPDADFISQSVAGWLPTPDPDGNDLYLPMVLTPTGAAFDHSQIGKVETLSWAGDFTGSVSDSTNLLLADGASYATNDYSPLGIPYSRLADRYFDDTVNMPIYGTGPDFVIASPVDVGAGTKILLFANGPGAGGVQPANGVTSPGFSYLKAFTQTAAGYNVKAFVRGDSSTGNPIVFTLVTDVVNPGTAPADPTGDVNCVIGNILNTPNTPQRADWVCNNTASIAGKTITFTASTVLHTLTYDQDNAGTPAANTINVPTGYSGQDIAVVTAQALNGGAGCYITCVAQTSITNGSYFTFTTPNGDAYYVYYTLTAGSNDPAAAGTGIEVLLVANDTAAQVAEKTLIAINSFYFAVPNYQGLFLRGLDTTGEWDKDYLSRFSYAPTYVGGQVGTIEYDYWFNHRHGITDLPVNINIHSYSAANTLSVAGTNLGGTPATLSSAGAASGNTNYIGGSETRPVNANVIYAIRY